MTGYLNHDRDDLCQDLEAYVGTTDTAQGGHST